MKNPPKPSMLHDPKLDKGLKLKDARIKAQKEADPNAKGQVAAVVKAERGVDTVN